MSNSKFLILCASAAAFMMAACDDDSSSTQPAGPKVLANSADLVNIPCTENNLGEMLYVSDVAELYFCANGTWISTKGADGKDGLNGADGKDGVNGRNGTNGVKGKDGQMGLDGTSCVAQKVKSKDQIGIEISCGDEVIDTLWNGIDGTNGESGKKGESGDDGTSCTAAKVSKDGRNGVELSCDGSVVDTVWNGTDGKGSDGTSCTAAKVSKDGRNGVELSCDGEVIDTVWNGTDGKGSDGTSCTAAKVSKDGRNGVELTCDGDVIDTVWNGIDGKASSGTSCTAAKVSKDGRNGVELSCDGEVIDTVWNGTDGKNGKSAYEIAKENGFDGSEEEWLESLKADAIYGQFVDERDGQLYRTVRIGEQVWMAQNLNYGDSSKTPNLKGATWCGGGEDGTVNEGDCSIYGRLYTWAAAVNEPEDKCGYGHECNLSGPVQGICPDGWHLPDTSEFRTLWNAVGGQDVAGTMLKSTNGWVYDGNGLDTNGFSAFPAGYRRSGGYFSLVGNGAHFWSSTENNSYNSYNVYLYCTIASADKYDYSKDYGFSIRCLKDSD